MTDSVFDGSNGWKHAGQLVLQVARRAYLKAGTSTIKRLRTFHNLQINDKKRLMEHILFVLINATDGESDHKNASIQNQEAQLSLIIFFDLHVSISTRNASDGELHQFC